MSYLAMLPWFLFYLTYSYYIDDDLRGEKDVLKWVKKNFWKMFRFDNLFLIIIFIYFIRYHNQTVNIMLFFMINFYMFINILYDRQNPKIKFGIIVPYFIVALVPIICYLIFKNFVLSSLIMFGITFFAYLIAIKVRLLSKYFQKK